MVVMDTSFTADEYDVIENHHPIEEARKEDQKRKGTPLRCWGRADYTLPNLNKIFIPSHVLLQAEPNENVDPAFHILVENQESEEFFSIYDAVPESSDKLHTTDDPNEEIFFSDSSNWTSENEEDFPEENNSCNFSNKVSECIEKDVKIESVLPSDMIEDNSDMNGYLRLSQSSLQNETDSKGSQQPIRFTVEVDNDVAQKVARKINRCDLEDVPMASYKVERKVEENFTLFNPKQKHSKSKKNKGKKTKDQISFAELKEIDFAESDRRESVDELQLYYQNFDSYDEQALPVSSNFDFPELAPIADETKITAKESPKKKQVKKERNMNFKSLAESFLPSVQDHKSQEEIRGNSSALHQKELVSDHLIIKNIPLCLSKENLRDFLADFGKINHLELTADGANSFKATVIMDCDLDWVIDSLSGFSLVSDDTLPPLECYVAKGNSEKFRKM